MGEQTVERRPPPISSKVYSLIQALISSTLEIFQIHETTSRTLDGKSYHHQGLYHEFSSFFLELPGWGISPQRGTCHHWSIQNKLETHPCPEWDSNQQLQCLFSPKWHRIIKTHNCPTIYVLHNTAKSVYPNTDWSVGQF
jgi:hypothetical protein